ncbi:unnamed protein product [Linum trigynum]|uniref:Uncharacterized protein n=1 Tax=Linum trigynum TaxID=586398 RepID=A0AAV2EVV0_9ROSI
MALRITNTRTKSLLKKIEELEYEASEDFQEVIRQIGFSPHPMEPTMMNATGWDDEGTSELDWPSNEACSSNGSTIYPFVLLGLCAFRISINMMSASSQVLIF